MLTASWPARRDSTEDGSCRNSCRSGVYFQEQHMGCQQQALQQYGGRMHLTALTLCRDSWLVGCRCLGRDLCSVMQL
jgi:hypothetical protein